MNKETDTKPRPKLRTILLSPDEINVLIGSLHLYEFHDENPYGSLAVQKLGQRLDLILTNQ